MNYWALGCIIVSSVMVAYNFTLSIIKDNDSYTSSGGIWSLSLVCSMMLLY